MSPAQNPELKKPGVWEWLKKKIPPCVWSDCCNHGSTGPNSSRASMSAVCRQNSIHAYLETKLNYPVVGLFCFFSFLSEYL